MDKDSIKKKLEEAGIPLSGGWENAGGKKGQIPLVMGKQAEALREIEKLLQKQVEADKAEVANLHASLQRLKHGGGV
jgi:hypothetical protein